MTEKHPAPKKSRETTPTSKPGLIVTYELPTGDGEAPAILGDGYITVFGPTGPYVAHDVPKGTKAGCWH